MLKDITNKKVDIVIVKDLSRLGINYIKVGELLDSILLLYEVKLISINDNIDGLNNEMEHIKNINEGKKWNISTITGIINNKVYTGDLIQQKRKRYN